MKKENFSPKINQGNGITPIIMSAVAINEPIQIKSAPKYRDLISDLSLLLVDFFFLSRSGKDNKNRIDNILHRRNLIKSKYSEAMIREQISEHEGEIVRLAVESIIFRDEKYKDHIPPDALKFNYEAIMIDEINCRSSVRY